jgi:hypothetical protein
MAPSGAVRNRVLVEAGMMRSAPMDRKYATTLFRNTFSSCKSSSRPRAMVSTRNRAIRSVAFLIIVYGSTQRSSPRSSMPPIHPYSSDTAFRNPWDAYTDKPGCQSILIGTAFMLHSNESKPVAAEPVMLPSASAPSQAVHASTPCSTAMHP